MMLVKPFIERLVLHPLPTIYTKPWLMYPIIPEYRRCHSRWGVHHGLFRDPWLHGGIPWSILGIAALLVWISETLVYVRWTWIIHLDWLNDAVKEMDKKERETETERVGWSFEREREKERKINVKRRFSGSFCNRCRNFLQSCNKK